MVPKSHEFKTFIEAVTEITGLISIDSTTTATLWVKSESLIHTQTGNLCVVTFDSYSPRRHNSKLYYLAVSYHDEAHSSDIFFTNLKENSRRREERAVANCGRDFWDLCAVEKKYISAPSNSPAS